MTDQQKKWLKIAAWSVGGIIVIVLAWTFFKPAAPVVVPPSTVVNVNTPPPQNVSGTQTTNSTPNVSLPY